MESEEEKLFERPWNKLLDRFCGPDTRPGRSHLWARWLFLRALGAIFFSAFFSLAYQIHGLVGPHGILPADHYLDQVKQHIPNPLRFWYAPTLLWLDAGDGALTALVGLGLASSALLFANIWPRLTLSLSVAFFLSFIAATRVFSSYQSDGMLLEAGFLAIWLAPRGLRPKLGASQPASRMSLFLLQWEWFRIYFESGIVKLTSGDKSWHDLTAMDRYYENGPLPTWIGWYAHQLPEGFHAASALFTLMVELAVVWMLFLPRRWRIACFLIVTPMQIGIILTANYAFLNYIVLALGVLLLDDDAFARVRLRSPRVEAAQVARWRQWGSAAVLTWVLYATTAVFVLRGGGVLLLPATLLEPFRFANRYGLFAVMTTARYEIEFQGSADGQTWVAYPFRYKPQDPKKAPGIYAPYQPRFEWNLWFASLRDWEDEPWVVDVLDRLIHVEPSVLSLFADDPFAGAPPKRVRAVRWQYWFTEPAERRRDGTWWRRSKVGPYAPTLELQADGTTGVIFDEQL